METEQAKHETEESLMLAQYGTSCHHPHKLQNGTQSSEKDSLQINEDSNWITNTAHYKPSKGVSAMKRYRENCDIPSLEQGPCKINGDLTNGELNHGFTEESVLVHQPKKMKVDAENKGNPDKCYNLANSFSELESSSQRTEINFDKRNCHIPNGDIFCLPRNKQVPNGDASSSSTIQSTPGDLLEETLSQYFPEQVSIAPQTSESQLDTVIETMANQLSKEGAQPPALASGFSNSSNMSDSQQPVASANGRNNYNSVNYSVNGYSNNYEVGQQQQHHHLQKTPSYSSQEIDLGSPQGMISLSKTASGSQQHPNGGSCLVNDTKSQSIHIKAKQEYNSVRYGSFHNSGIQESKQSEKPNNDKLLHHGPGRGPQYGRQIPNFQENVGKQHKSDGLGHVGSGFQHHTGLENGIDGTSQQRANISCSTPSQTGWIERNPHSQQQSTSDTSSQPQEQDMWRGFPGKPQSEQLADGPQVHSQLPEPNSVQRYGKEHTQGIFTNRSQRFNNVQQEQQNCLSSPRQSASIQHNTAPEWQQLSPKISQMQQTFLQKIPEQRKLLQNQEVDNCYESQPEPEHLDEDKDLQEILSAGFVTTQQQHCLLQRPLSHPPQFEVQQLKSPNYRPHSQPPPSQHQPQTDQPHTNSSAQSSQDIHRFEPLAFTFNNTTEMQQPQPHRQFPSNSGSKHLKHFQPQQPNNHCHETNQVDFPQTSTQSQPHLPQGLVNQQVTTQMHPKAEQQMRTSCTQFKTGPRLPLGPGGPHGDFQKHAALRMHLLQKQERHGPLHPPHSSSDPKQTTRGVKMENEPRFESTVSQRQEQLLQMQEGGMGGIQIKQENHQFLCAQNKKQGSILASMEQSLRQYQLSPVFEKKPLVIGSSNKVKVESSGPVTILSTNTDMNGIESAAGTSSTVALKNSTPKKEQLLKSFIESPMKLLDTPIKNLLDTPMKTQYEIPSCHCVDQIIEKDEGPYYTHLGSAPSVAGIREMMEKRSGLTGHAIRIEKVIYTGKEGKSTQGCPIAKWVIRRSSVEEKVLVLVRQRNGHRCDTACIIVVILVWEGIQTSLADRLYLELSETLTKHGAHTQRRCAFNEERTCACQGLNPDAAGASFSFGCSWSMYYNGCKFARSKVPRRFKLQGDDVREEERIERNFQNLATLLGPLYKTMAPEAYGNQVEYEHRAPDCRLGLKEGRPFSGVTACMDFCAHAHRDLHNMQGGSTVVCTLTREDNREIGKIPEDEQLHVLPLYKASTTDEFGSEEGQQEKMKSGAIQVLSAFRRQVRMLAEPAKSCRQKKLDAKKAAANKNALLEGSSEKAEKALQAKSKASTYENAVQSTPLPGAVASALQSGHPSFPLGVQPQRHQHQGVFPPYPAPTNAAIARFSNHTGPFPSTSKPGSMYSPQPPSPASPYLSSFHVPNSYMNGTNSPYPSPHCNGGMPMDSYHTLYTSNQKHPDMYRHQQPALYSEQQYGVHQHFEVSYPRYSEPGLQVNGYSAIQPGQAMTHYSPYGPHRTPDAQFINPLSRAPTAHGGADFARAVNNGNQFGGYPNPYLPQSPHLLPSGQDPFHMQIKTEPGMPGPQMLSAQFSGGCLNPETQSSLGLPNGGVLGSNVKQEPGTPQTPTAPPKPEMWSDNEHNFLDPEIGGVAVAPSHGSVLIECAKRELHATTPLKNPDRNHPTRISLVFYQHKNLNEAKHGLAMWEAKMADKAREKEEEAERNGGEGTPSKGSKKGVKREHSDSEATGEPPYKRFIKALMEGSSSCTTNTYAITTPYAFTKVTGPYSQFV
nr:methylcytosine dioxygenase TET2 [Nothobranchius furzeri]